MAESKEAESSKKSQRSIGKYNIYETLGKGGYSWVKKGQDTETGAIVALKFMNRATDQWALEQAEQVRTEIKSLTQIRHENVMKLYAYNLSAKYPLHEGGFVKTILLVLEYCPGGELFDILYYADKLDEVIARTYFHQMMYGLQAVHKAGIAHRDLKPQNLLLDTKFCLKITDFGLSKIMETEADRIMKTTYVGTRGYQAPELLKNQKYTNACDVFSMGVVLFILLAGYPPFEAAHKTDKWYRPLATGHPDKFWHVHRGAKINDTAKDLIEKMLSYRPSKRISVADILKHDWFDGPTEDIKNLKEKVIGRFVQARENRKKDAKKTKDLVESNHKKQQINPVKERDFKGGPGYDATLENKAPPAVPGGLPGLQMRKGLLSYYTKKKGYLAIQSLRQIMAEIGITVVYSPTKDTHKLDCEFGQLVQDQTLTYKFSVSCYRDDGIHNLINIQPQSIPDALAWRRILRNIMDTIRPYGILEEGGLPACWLDMQRENQKKATQPSNEAQPEDKPDDTETKEEEQADLPFGQTQWEGKPSESSTKDGLSEESTPSPNESSEKKPANPTEDAPKESEQPAGAPSPAAPVEAS